MIVLIGAIFLVSMSNNGTDVDNKVPTGSSSLEVTNVKELVEDCMEYYLEKGLSQYGDDLEEFEEYLDFYVKQCVEDMEKAMFEVEVFEEENEYFGYKADFGVLSTNLKLSNDEKSMIVDANYLISYEDDSKQVSIENFNIIMPISNNVEIKYDAEGKVKNDYLLVSPDKKYNLKIKKGTIAKVDGNNVEKISLEIKDKDSYLAPYTHVMGEVVYELNPDGATFNPPLELTFYYDQEDLYTHTNEADLKFAYYQEAGLRDRNWKVYEEGQIDVLSNIIKVDIDHFSTQAVVDDSYDGNISNIRDYITPPSTCATGEKNVFTNNSWCLSECSGTTDVGPCPEGEYNCDCYGGCHGNERWCGFNVSIDNISCSKIEDLDKIGDLFVVEDFNDLTYVGGNKVLATFDSDSIDVVSYTDGNITDIVVFNEYVYISTKNNGKIFRSYEGENWVEVYNNTKYSSIAGMVVNDGEFYAIASDLSNGRSTLIKTIDGTNWENVTKTDVVFSGLGVNESIIYGISGRHMYKYESGGFDNVEFDDGIYNSIFNRDLSLIWRGMLFKGNASNSMLQYDEKQDGNFQKACEVDEGSIVNLMMYQNNLYLVTGSNNDYNIYDVKITYQVEFIGNSTLAYEENGLGTGDCGSCIVTVDGETESGMSMDDGRTIYRFSKHGDDYCMDGTCEVEISCGETIEFPKPEIAGGGHTYPAGSAGRYETSDGFLWKGGAEHSPHHLAILIPGSYCGDSDTGVGDKSGKGPTGGGSCSDLSSPTYLKNSGDSMDMTYHGETNGGRPTFYTYKSASKFPKTFEVSVAGCASFTATLSSGCRYEHGGKSGYVVKESEVSGRGLAVVAPSSCKSSFATLTAK